MNGEAGDRMAGAVGEGVAVVVERRGPALWVRLERPEKSNAYTAGMLDALEEAIRQGEDDPAVRVLVVTGSGERAFCAGADREELEGRDWRDVVGLRSAAVFRTLRESRLVSIAAINGAAVGGGLELALSCDLRVAVSRARFWLPELALGVLPAAGALTLLPRMVGEGRARELVLGGVRWSASQALAIGLVTEVVDAAELGPAVGAWVDRVAPLDPEVLRLAKLALDEGWPTPSGAVDRVAQALLVSTKRSRKPPLDS